MRALTSWHRMGAWLDWVMLDPDFEGEVFAQGFDIPPQCDGGVCDRVDGGIGVGDGEAVAPTGRTAATSTGGAIAGCYRQTSQARWQSLQCDGASLPAGPRAGACA